MPARIGKQAVIVGAGVAGLTAARSIADFFELFIEVQSLLKSRSAYRDPKLVQRVKAVMAEAQAASN